MSVEFSSEGWDILKKEGLTCNFVSSEDLTDSYLPAYFKIER